MSDDLLAVVQRLQTRVNALETKTPSVPLWATVTSTNPLRVRLDTETDPIEATPHNAAGRIHESDRVLVQRWGTQIYVLGPSSGEPPGTILTYAGAVAPAGFLICDGSEYAAASYAALFAVIGRTYGGAAGTNTFRVPDLRGRVPVGYSSTDSDFSTLGGTGGEKAHTLTVGEMPAHTHGYSRSNVKNFVKVESSSTYGRSENVDATTDSTGGGGAHNNLQPYMVLNYIIKE